MMESGEGKKAVVGLKESLKEYSVAEPVQIGLCYSSLQNRYVTPLTVYIRLTFISC